MTSPPQNCGSNNADTKKESFCTRFEGKNSNAAFQVNSKLTKSKGDNITFGLRQRLSGAGVTSGQTLEGNEEKLTNYDFNVSLEEYAHAVRDAGPLDRQRVMYGLDEESKMALKEWGAEKRDSLMLKELLSTPTRVIYKTGADSTLTSTATAATAKGALTTSSLLSPATLDYAKVWAKTGGNRTITPIRPLKINGKEYYVFLAHPDAYYDLRRNSEWMQQIREAMPRGESNPIFSGALGVWNGIVLHEHEGHADKDAGAGFIATDAGSGGNVPWSKGVLFGQQALAIAEGKRGKLVAEEFDYGREHGFGWSMIMGVEQPTFNSQIYGSLGIYVARTQISDAS